MNLTYWSLKRPLTIIMVFLAIILLGIDGHLHLPVRRSPNIAIPAAQVVINDPGSSPSIVMNTVSNPLENGHWLEHHGAARCQYRHCDSCYLDLA